MKPHLLHSIFPFLFSSRSHLGQRPQPLWAKKGVDPSSTFSVLGKRDQLFLTNPLVTLKGLLRSLRAVQTVSKRNGSILIINTNPSLSLLCERFAFFSALSQLGTNRVAGSGQDYPPFAKGSNNPLQSKGRVLFCYEKWTGGLLSNWGKVSNSVETFDRFSNAFGPFLRENKIQFSTYKEMRKRYNGLLGFKLSKLQEESLFLATGAARPLPAKQSQICTEPGVRERRANNPRPAHSSAKGQNLSTNWKTGLKPKETHKQPIRVSSSEGSLSGGRYFNQKPDLIFLINCNENAHVLQEAASLKIPVIGITNTSTNQIGITYPIPGNSESASFVFFCLKWVTTVSTAPSVFSL